MYQTAFARLALPRDARVLVVPAAAQMRGYVAHWRPAAVVAVTRRTSRLGRPLTTVFRPPSFTTGRILVWRR